MRNIVELDGGLILGEGDSGKTKYVTIFCHAVKDCAVVESISLRESSRVSLERLEKAVKKLKTSAKRLRLPPILILDGLDENEKLARDVLELSEKVGKSCAIWVTSRPCAGAARLMSDDRFVKPFHLVPMTRDDIAEMAADIALDLEDFYKTLRQLGLMSFLAKPGGVVLMLHKYLTNGISRKSRLAMMEEIACDFAREMRDGAAVGEGNGNFSPEERLEAARWIAIQLFLSGKETLWVYGSSGAPNDALGFGDLCLGAYKRELLIESTDSCLFEPLEPNRLRLTYSDMADYLLAKWLVENKTVEDLLRILPDQGNYIADATARVLSWAGQYEPEFCLPMLEKKPFMFLGCHEAIRQFGIAKFFDCLVRMDFTLKFDDWSQLAGVFGFEDFREHCLDVLRQMAMSPVGQSFADGAVFWAFSLFTYASEDCCNDFETLFDICMRATNGEIQRGLLAMLHLYGENCEEFRVTSSFRTVEQSLHDRESRVVVKNNLMADDDSFLTSVYSYLQELGERRLTDILDEVQEAFKGEKNEWKKSLALRLLVEEDIERNNRLDLSKKAVSDFLLQSSSSAVSDGTSAAGGVRGPDMANRADCIDFLRTLYETVREDCKKRIHSERDAVNYILADAKDGDAHFRHCKIARQIWRSYGWKRSTFMTYCKQKPPKRKGLVIAAKSQAKKRLIARDIKGL